MVFADLKQLNGNDVIGYWYKGMARGCLLCMKGLKVLVHVTGFCMKNCFYCPISSRRRRADIGYVDEETLVDEESVIEEVILVNSKGVAISGGEPLSTIERVITLIRYLKDCFGASFHIHLYTSGFIVTPKILKDLDKAGLDEIRFHIVDDNVWSLVKFALRETSMSIGIEVPALDKGYLWNILENALQLNVEFVNINELEVTETNIYGLLLRGYRIDPHGKTVMYSKDIALDVVKKFIEIYHPDVLIRICTATFKDSIQHRFRLMRKSFSCLQRDCVLLEDGLMRCGDKDLYPLKDFASELRLGQQRRLQS